MRIIATNSFFFFYLNCAFVLTLKFCNAGHGPVRNQYAAFVVIADWLILSLNMES